MRRNLVRLLGVVALLTPLTCPLTARGEGQATGDDVRRALLSLPSYGPFDLISYQDADGTLTLRGAVYRPFLRKQAEEAVRAVPGVREVVNDIEVLPASFEDDRLRREVFLRIYSDIGLWRYGTPLASWGHRTASRASRSAWPGFEPAGNYAIHVVVKGGRVTLFGTVDRAADRTKAEMRAREVFGVMGIDNQLAVAETASRS